MSVIAEISIPADEFALGRVLRLSSSESAELESLVPSGEQPVPYFWVYDVDTESFESTVAEAPVVDTIQAVDVYDDRALYKVEWTVERDGVFHAVQAVEAYVLNATGEGGTWEFELRFSSHPAMSAFQTECQDSDVDFDVLRVYNPSQPELGPWYGLTDRQREALEIAVERGYYDIPRNCTTVDIADELDISDQAVTERLRRAIKTLTTNTVLNAD